jgi:sec-independent protein translocase protein TatA
MGGLSVWHWLIFLVVALLLFGGSGKISSIMGDVAKGIKSFKKGMAEDETATPAQDPFKRDEPRALDGTAPAGTTTAQHASTPQPNKAS